MEVTGLASLYRPADEAIMTYDHAFKQLQMDLPIGFKDLKVQNQLYLTILENEEYFLSKDMLRIEQLQGITFFSSNATTVHHCSILVHGEH